MKVIIANSTYETNSWDEPRLVAKRVKNKVLEIIIYGNHRFKSFPELVILDKSTYRWILMECQLINQYIRKNPYDETYNTYLTISYKSRSGSHIKDFITGQIRNWNIDKLLD